MRMLKSSCYIPIVSHVTLWERNIIHANVIQPQTEQMNSELLSPCHGTAALPCSRFTDHMKTFSESFKLRSLCFLHFPGKFRNNPQKNHALCSLAHYTRSPVVSETYSEEESHGEASSSQTPPREWGKNLLMFTVRPEIKRARGAPSEAWNITPLYLEAAGRHIKRHMRPQSQPSCSSRADSAPLAHRPSSGSAGGGPDSRPLLPASRCPSGRSPPRPPSATGLCGGRRSPPRPGARSPRAGRRPRGRGGGGAVAGAPGRLHKHPRPREEGPRADARSAAPLPRAGPPPPPPAAAARPYGRFTGPRRADRCEGIVGGAARPGIKARPGQREGPQMDWFPHSHCWAFVRRF
ncbi:unnamed protein product [Nyctereutes procyonoides]|uniref:(raccoon dog) hypothetical protein n=1 Tax=Nyctereutes procyonoides TaxID=34880 RepID=A0A811YX60_NYCPR|nr:unnamed protein product [Nyctereutes procyonoides]